MRRGTVCCLAVSCLTVAALTTALALAVVFFGRDDDGDAKLTLNLPERWAEDQTITGRVTGVASSKHRVAIYTFTYGRWTSMPGQGLIPLDRDGNFIAEFREPKDQYWTSLGVAVIGEEVPAIDVILPVQVARQEDKVCSTPPELLEDESKFAKAREIVHRGVMIGEYHCIEKHTEDPSQDGGWGGLDPGNNRWDARLVEQLPNNGLRFSIGFDDDSDESEYYSSEVHLVESLGYGLYVTQVDATNMAPMAGLTTIFGAFTFDHCAEFPFRELDFEMGQFGFQDKEGNAQHAVQPWEVPENVVRYTVPKGDATLAMLWEEGRATIETYEGRQDYPFDPDTLVKSTVFEGEVVPEPGTEKWTLNLWQEGAPDVPLRARSRLTVDVYDFKHHTLSEIERIDSAKLSA